MIIYKVRSRSSTFITIYFSRPKSSARWRRANTKCRSCRRGPGGAGRAERSWWLAGPPWPWPIRRCAETLINKISFSVTWFWLWIWCSKSRVWLISTFHRLMQIQAPLRMWVLHTRTQKYTRLHHTRPSPPISPLCRGLWYVPSCWPYPWPW